MELDFLPIKPVVAKTYKHFIVNADMPREPISRDKAIFFYLGGNRSKIKLLVESFESGYAADSIEKGISVLGRILDGHKSPDVIIVDPELGQDAIKQFYSYIVVSKSFLAVPFLLDTSNLSAEKVKGFRNLLFFDDFINLETLDAEKFKAKVHFLNKVKKSGFSKTQDQSSLNYLNLIESVEAKIIIKRVFDFIISLIAIIILSPLFLLIALAIKIESGGPILYVSKRAGRGYKIFNFYKFRTMVLGADEKLDELSHLNHYYANDKGAPVFFKVLNDSRKTRIGAFLRSTSMDELPQFFNVLLGQMSLVGNRPLPLYEAAKLTTDDWAERFLAPAGITGLWQIKKRRQGEMSMEERINLDIAYSHKYNFMYDLWIMANTPTALFQKSNA